MRLNFAVPGQFGFATKVQSYKEPLFFYGLAGKGRHGSVFPTKKILTFDSALIKSYRLGLVPYGG
jgi:hypothetical protein